MELALTDSDRDHIIYLAKCTLAKVPGKQNWLEEDAVGGLPDYICRIARAILRTKGHTVSQAIAIAVGRVKTWASGGGGVTAKTRGIAAKALAEWEEKKKAAKLNNKVKASNITLLFALSYNIDDVRRQYNGSDSKALGTSDYSWIREMWSDYLIVEKEKPNSPAVVVKVPYTVDATGKAEFGDEVPVKQTYVELSAPELQTSLTDAQLEKALLIPCTYKDRGSLSEMVRLSSQRTRIDDNILSFAADKPNLLALANHQLSQGV